MRPSKKTKIIRTAIDLIEAGSLDSVSYDALAQSSGLSKSGIIYHFPSREEMMRAVHQYMADQWEAELEAAGGGPAEQLTGSQRLRAVVVSLRRSATKTELLLEIDARSNPELAAIWQAVDQRWVPSPAEIDSAGTLGLERFLVLLMADGLWLHDYVHEDRLSESQREALVDHVLAKIDQTATDERPDR
ncbi:MULTISPECIES: TetR/AcrR family transcriptional regulator [Auritidibacter]|nr:MULTISPECIES: TetR family transcriptional regulator [Auritidibacter]AXR73919.1 TetR/AcrR family transcriptional regulator [Auritidibacter sp. NML130574]PXA77266.1 TetR/AcrR family transcriptional regulator [Auritidibacter sp. NML100628]WGH84833.1 TetR family transcriptional regulator [Auritidibacter ignavus]WHS34424.1 TetR family transcriptional regulator [Auritidibacter ignavus]